MNIDIHTLAIILSFLMTAHALAYFAHTKMNKTHQGLKWWTVGSMMLAVGFIFNFLRDAQGIGQFSILANNAFFILGLYFIYRGVLWVLHKHEKPFWFIVLFVSFCLSIYYFTYVDESLPVRAGLISFVIGVLTLLIATRLFLNQNQVTSPLTFQIGSVFIVISILFFARILAPFIEPVENMFSSSIIQSSTYIIIMIASTFWTFGFIILVNQQLNEQIQEDNKNMALIFNTSPDSVLITKLNDGKIISANDGFSTLTGFSKEEVIGKSTTEVGIWKYPDDRHQLTQPLREKGYCENLEIVFQRKNKSTFTALLSAQTIYLQEIPHIITVTRDISDRKMAEQEIQIAKLRMENIIAGTNVGTWEWNVQTGETVFNDFWAEMLGYRLDELEPINVKTWQNLTHPEDHKKAEKIISKHFSGALPYYDCELRMKHKNGNWIWIQDRGRVATRTHDGKPLMMFGMHSLITERKENEEKIRLQNQELQKINAEKDKFFSIIAHDLKSPFNSIVGFSELLKENVNKKNYEPLTKYAEIILQSSNRAMELLTNLMEWSRSQTGRLEFNPIHFEMISLVQDVVLLFSDSAFQKSIAINLDLPTHAPVFADKEMISTILRNLLSNAIKFTNTHGKILIKVQIEPHRLLVSVSDNGIGIPIEAIENIFRIDSKYTTPGTQNETGTGLGLILCKDFIKKHKGEIWVESEQKKGSVFSFFIPNL